MIWQPQKHMEYMYHPKVGWLNHTDVMRVADKERLCIINCAYKSGELELAVQANVEYHAKMAEYKASL